jgi:hypothetical protein
MPTEGVSLAHPANAPVCCLDLLLTLDRSTTLGVENKLFADEGRGSDGQREQLRKYLALPVNRLAYVRAQDADVAPDVLNRRPKYLAPPDRRHFLWSDFYQDIEASLESGGSLTRALLDLFLYFGFEPPNPQIGDLKGPDKTIAEANRRNFAKLWEVARTELSRAGWTSITPGSIAELYVDGGRSLRIKKAWINPTWSRGLLRVRLTPHPGKTASVEEALRGARLPHHDDVDIARGLAAKRVRDSEYVQVTIAFRKLFGNATEAGAMKRELADFVAAVFREAD